MADVGRPDAAGVSGAGAGIEAVAAPPRTTRSLRPRILDFDLDETGLVEQPGELADGRRRRWEASRRSSGRTLQEVVDGVERQDVAVAAEAHMDPCAAWAT